MTAPKSRRGFASMDPQRQREIASMGGKQAHLVGGAHTFTPAEASAAGKKGAEAKRLKRLAAAGVKV